MNIKKIHSRKKGFTLVELIIAMTIFGIMSVMTILIYFNISESSRRLQISREIIETSRQITEIISQEIDENKIFKDADTTFLQNIPKENILPVGIDENDSSKAKKYFVYLHKDDNTGTYSQCGDEEKNNNEIGCGLFLIQKDENGNDEYFNLVDTSRIKENEKRVKINDLKFDISGEENDVKKVTLRMTISLTKRAGVPNSLINGSKMDIQTTISERIYK